RGLRSAMGDQKPYRRHVHRGGLQEPDAEEAHAGEARDPREEGLRCGITTIERRARGNRRATFVLRVPRLLRSTSSCWWRWLGFCGSRPALTRSVASAA